MKYFTIFYVVFDTKMFNAGWSLEHLRQSLYDEDCAKLSDVTHKSTLHKNQSRILGFSLDSLCANIYLNKI